ncbi:hypothetical protein KW797_01895 [Candidatus Parcubacteria bacterium]|nr:hypothetical protein [Candidatus Parcubacteria bacterium]
MEITQTKEGVSTNWIMVGCGLLIGLSILAAGTSHMRGWKKMTALFPSREIGECRSPIAIADATKTTMLEFYEKHPGLVVKKTAPFYDQARKCVIGVRIYYAEQEKKVLKKKPKDAMLGAMGIVLIAEKPKENEIAYECYISVLFTDAAKRKIEEDYHQEHGNTRRIISREVLPILENGNEIFCIYHEAIPEAIPPAKPNPKGRTRNV